MAKTFKEWLRDQFKQTVSVQTAALAEDADIVVHTWSGLRAHIYMLHEPIRTRSVKRALQLAGHSGINTLFLLNTSLVPADGERFIPDEWLLALHALMGERLYLYGITPQGKPYLAQVHLEQVTGKNEYEAWHGPHFGVERLRFYRTSVKMRALKGDWLVMDFSAPTFWKNSEYRQFRTKKARAEREQRETRWQTWSAYQQTWRSDPNGGGNRSHQPAAPLQEHLNDCYRLLGIGSDASRDEVKSAFRQHAKKFHPDTSPLPPAEAELKFQAINAAYEYIKSANGWN